MHLGRLRPILLLLLALCAALSRAQEAAPGRMPESTGDTDEPAALGGLREEPDELDSARESYLAGIERLIQENGELSPLLMEPYAGLAQIYLREERPLEAIAVLEQARHISQRNFGLLSLEQMTVLEDMSGAYLLMGDTRRAQDIQRERLRLALRRFGESDLRVVPYRKRLAEYYDLSRMRLHAREQHEAILAVQSEAYGENDARLLPTLGELLRMDTLLGTRSPARRRLLEVLETGQGVSAFQKGDALAVLGDWELARGRTEAALTCYRDAYSALRVQDPAVAAEYFAAPRLIDFVPPPSPVDLDGDRGTHAWGSVSARLLISAEGRALQVTIVQADPPGLMEARYRERLSEASFRPRLRDGEPMESAAVTYRHEFRYFTAVD